MTAATLDASPEGVPANEVWRLPFSLPSFRTGLTALRGSVVAGWQRWAEEAVLIAYLAGQVQRDSEDWAWKSFLREVALARSCSDRAAAKEVFVAVALVQTHPTTLELVRGGRMPQYNA